jgi:Fe-S cluster biogenesis protein NfuA
MRLDLLDFHMRAERTPNPNSVKWVLSTRLLVDGASAHFESPVGADVSPLAARLFVIEDVTGVFFASNFVTVTKQADAEWPALAQALVDQIKAFAASGEPALGPAYQAVAAQETDEVATRIQRVLDEEIRPYVAQDGGDVLFAGFHDGVVEVYLQGSCSGCPSSTATLKLGIEPRLREAVPEVQEVVAIQ